MSSSFATLAWSGLESADPDVLAICAGVVMVSRLFLSYDFYQYTGSVEERGYW